MILANMIKTDEDALICDLAETYQIYDYKSLPAYMVATFSVGLRENSRIKMKLSNQKVPFGELLLSMISDELTRLIWMKTENGAKGINPPKSIVSLILNNGEENTVNDGFQTVEEYEKARLEIIREGG